VRACLLLLAVGCQPAPSSSSSPAGSGSGSGSAVVAALADEAAHRPGGTITVEQVTAALAQQAITFDAKQYLAATARAAYCAGGRTADGISIAVCEYASPAAAEAGRAFVEQRFPNIPGRRIVVRRATMLTTTAIDTGVAPQREAIEAVFGAL